MLMAYRTLFAVFSFWKCKETRCAILQVVYSSCLPCGVLLLTLKAYLILQGVFEAQKFSKFNLFEHILQGSNSANVFLCLWQPSFSHSCSKLEKKRHGLYHMLKFQFVSIMTCYWQKSERLVKYEKSLMIPHGKYGIRWFLAYRLFFLNM